MSFPEMTVSRVEDRKMISDFLSFDRLWASEALLSLDDEIWPLGQWYGYQDGNRFGFALMFDCIKPVPVFLAGEPGCLAHVIRSEHMPESIFVETPPSCTGTLREFYQFKSGIVMSKMALKHFREGKTSLHPDVRRLKPDDFLAAKALYYRNADFGHFDADQFLRGIYFGAYQGKELVSMAGTTVLCPDYRTATIGNVLTDSHFRNQGYAMSELLLLCRSLLDLSFDCICIKVNRGNTSAIALYRRLGFVKQCEYFEGLGEKIS